MALYHAYSQTVADGTATSVVRPSDWNSGHIIQQAISGNTSGVSTVSGTNVVYQAGNNVTLSAAQGANAATIVISGANTVAQTNYVFSNSNNVSFGTNASTVTASASFNQTVDTRKAGTGFTSTSTAGVLVVGTNNTDGLSLGIPNYITTYQNDLTSGRAGTGFSSTTTAGTAIVGTLNTDGLSVGVPAFITTWTVPTQSTQPVAVSGSNGSFNFSTLTLGSSNGMHFYTTNGSVVGSYTVPTQSVQTQASGNIVGSGFTSTTATAVAGTLDSSGLLLAVPQVNFGDSNGFSFISTAGSIVGSYTVPTQSVQTQASGAIAGTGFTSTTTNGTAVVGTLGTNGLSLGVPAYQTAAGAGDGNNVIGVNGVATSASTTYILSNANNVTFGLNAGTITASASFAGGAQSVAVSGSNGSFNFSTLSMGSSNGMHFYTTNGSIVGSYTVPTQTVDTNKAGTGFTSTTTAGTAVVGTLNTNGLSIGVPTIITNAITTQTVQPVAASGSNGSFAYSTLTFGSSNGMHFYTTNGSIVGSYTVPTQSVQTQASGNIAGAGFTSTTTAGSVVVATHNSAGLSMGVPQFITTYAAQSNQTGNFYVSGNTTQLSSTAGLDLRSISFEGAGIASVGVSNGRVLVSVPSGGGGGDGVNIVQIGTTGTTGTAFSSISGTVQLNGSNGIIVSQNNSNQIVISYAGTNDIEQVNALGNTAGTNTFAPGNTLYLAGGNGVTLSGNGSTLSFNVNTNPDGWSIVGNTAGASNTYQWTNDTLYLSGGNNITLSQNGSTIAIVGAAGGGGATMPSLSWPVPAMFSSQTMAVPSQSTAVVVPFQADNNISFDYLQIARSVSLASSTFASTANTTFSFGQVENHTLLLYSRGTGANSQSLQQMVSTTAQVSWSVNVAYGSASNTSHFLTFGMSYPNSTTTSAFSTGFTTSNISTINISTNNASAVSGMKLMAIPFATSLSAGKYWLAWHNSTTSSTQGTNLSGVRLLFSSYGLTQLNNTLGAFGQVNNASVHFGVGTFTTVGGATTASMGFSNISSSASHLIPYFTLLRST